MTYKTNITAKRKIKYSFDLSTFYRDFKDELGHYLVPELEVSKENPFREGIDYSSVSMESSYIIDVPSWANKKINEIITEITNDLFSDAKLLSDYVIYYMSNLTYKHDDLSVINAKKENIVELLGKDLCDRYKRQISDILIIREKYLSELIV